MLREALEAYRYTWPSVRLETDRNWRVIEDGAAYERWMPEDREQLSKNSSWPAFFPAPLSIISTNHGGTTALEKEVGASIINRFPYVIALSFCRENLSARHHPRRRFMEILERSGKVAVQFLDPGGDLDRVMKVIDEIPDERTDERIAATGLPTRTGKTVDADIFQCSYMVYEASLVEPGRDFEKREIYSSPWMDMGSHRVYFFEINAIQLREDIARGRSQIHWRALPAWTPAGEMELSGATDQRVEIEDVYLKKFMPHYDFPSPDTIAFEADEFEGGFAIKHLPPLPEDQVEVDNDRARWPSFFPAPVGMITARSPDGLPNVMPCGSTTILSRHPLIVTPCISYAAINERYAPRATLDFILKSGRFGCGVPFIHDAVVDAISYAGSYSFRHDSSKATHAGLAIRDEEWAPVLPALPVHFDCEVVNTTRLGTHYLFQGEVRRIRVRSDLTPENPLEWCGWADIDPLDS
jgi:flavin reductase (DIM6/NTAB) family NADH-FMN oxidoreductase RutF